MALSACILGGLLASALLRRHPDYRTRPLLRETGVQVGRAWIELARTPRADGGSILSGRMSLASISGVERATAIQLRLDLMDGPPGSRLPLDSIVLQEIDGPLRFELRGPSVFPVPQTRQRLLFRLERTGGDSGVSAAEERHFQLEVRSPVDLRISVVTSYQPGITGMVHDTNYAVGWMPLQSPYSSGASKPPAVLPIPMAQLVFPLSQKPARRSEAIAYVWGFEGGASTVGWLAVCTTMAFASGIGLLISAGVPGAAAVASIRAGCGGALVFAGLACTQALCCFPLQGHDEQDHLWSFLHANGVTQPAPEIARMARVIHWDRIVMGPGEVFSADDMLEPYEALRQEWTTASLRMVDRSGLAQRMWMSWKSAVQPGRPARTLFRVRLLQSFMVSLAFGLATAALTLSIPDHRARPFAVLGLLLVPAFPYLAMGVSNYGLVTAAALLLAGAAASIRGSPRSDWLVGAVFGLALGVGLQSSRSALAMVGMVPVLAVRWLPRAEFERKPWQIVAFWLGLGFAVILPSWMTTVEYVSAMRVLLGGALPPGIGSTALRLPFGAAVLGCCAVGMSVEAMTRWLRCARPASMRLAPVAQRHWSANAAAWLPAVVVGFWMVRGTFGVRPHSTSADRTKPVVQFLWDNWVSFADSLGAGKHDFELCESFWNAMGWLRVTLPDSVFNLLVPWFTLGIVVGLMRLARAADWVRWATWGIVGVAWLAYLSLMLLASRQNAEPITGRYLVGVYAVFLAVASRGWLPWFAELDRRIPMSGSFLLGAGPAAIHGCMMVRYLNHYY